MLIDLMYRIAKGYVTYSQPLVLISTFYLENSPNFINSYPVGSSCFNPRLCCFYFLMFLALLYHLFQPLVQVGKNFHSLGKC